MSRPTSFGRPMAASTMIEKGGGGRKGGGIPSKASSKTNTTAALPKKNVPSKTSVTSAKQEPAKNIFKMPGFSVPLQAKHINKEVEKLKKKMIRRNKPEGEDINKLKEICKGLKGVDVTIEEFITLVAPSTGDNGDLLRNILFEELSVFRDTTRNIYDTMTQDISEVLTNEHIQITTRCKDNEQMYKDKMTRTMKEVYQYIPDFSFKDYYTNVDYLKDKFPPAGDEVIDPEQKAAMLRQEAYHRYQWLKSEGERLKEENNRLQGRFNQLKKQQKDILKAMAHREEKAEASREILEQKEEELKDKLDELNQSIEKTIVENEKSVVLEASAKLGGRASLIAKAKEMREKGKSQGARRKPPSQEWAAQAAAEIETNAATEELVAESSQVALEVKESRSKGAIRKTMIAKKQKGKRDAFHFSPIKEKTAPEQPQQRSPFHYSPPRTPPERRQQAQRQASPFHYSPPRSPPRQYQEIPEDLQSSIARGGPPPTPQESRLRRAAAENMNVPRRRGTAPRDSWGGFQ